MKKCLSILMVCLLALTLIGCAGEQKDSLGQASGISSEGLPDQGEDNLYDMEEPPKENLPNGEERESAAPAGERQEAEETLPEDGIYTSRDDVALYIYLYGHLPSNFITKKEAEKLGWQGGSLEPYAPDKCIGGNRFGNYEGLLPEKEGRSYTECDIDTLGADRRGAKRIVFSNDGLIYYTEDHYESFELLYGEEQP